MAEPGAADRVTRDRIEAKLRELRGEVESTAEAAKPVALAAGLALGVLVLAASYLLGRRRGRRRSAVVEIRRV